MGGEISVDSMPGRGSTFAFTARFGLQPHPPETTAASPPAVLRGLPVLVVDDNATNRRILEEWLRGSARDCRVIVASIGAAIAGLAAAGFGAPTFGVLLIGALAFAASLTVIFWSSNRSYRYYGPSVEPRFPSPKG